MEWDNVVEIQNRVYVCVNCSTQNIVCHGCQTIIKDMNFYYWLILSRLEGHEGVTIRFAQNSSNKAIKIIDLLKHSVGLIESGKRVNKVKKLKLELECNCSNKLLVFTDSEEKIKNYICKKCMKKEFKVIDNKDTKIEIMDVRLDKMPAVIALTERRR